MTGTNYGTLSDVASGHFGSGANYDDDHVPVPAEHAPTRRAFQAGGSARQPIRFVVGEAASLDECMVSGAWVSSDTVMDVQP